MGQRHQLFVIARPAPGQRYRCLAVAHDQWLYGASALNTCLRLLRIFSNPLNRFPLQQEVAFAREYYSREDAEELEREFEAVHQNAPIPFPFVAACLVFGASNNTESGGAKLVYLEHMGLRFDAGDNNDGITIIDITDLDNVRYCFVDFHGMESEREVPLHTPLSAMDYILAYYDPHHPFMVHNRHTQKALKKYDLVQVEALNDCWPDEAWRVSDQDAKNFSNSHGPTPGNDDKMPVSLRDKATHKLLHELLHDPSPDVSLLDVPLGLAGVRKVALDYLIEHPSDVAKCPAGPAILALGLHGQTTVDLSLFPDLTADGIREVLGSEQLKAAEIVNLSGTQAFATTDDIKATMGVLGPNVRELYHLVRPGRARDDISVALALRSGLVRDVRLPQKMLLGAVLSVSLRDLRNGGDVGQEDIVIKEAGLDSLNLLKPRDLKFDGPPAPTSPLWPTAQFPVSQLLIRDCSEGMTLPGDIIHLHDGLIGPARVITGLLAVIRSHWLDTINRGITKLSLKVAFAFATEAATVMIPLKDGGGGEGGRAPPSYAMEINHPPIQALSASTREQFTFWTDSRKDQTMQPLGPDRWAAIAAFDYPRDTLGGEGGADIAPILTDFQVHVGFVRTRDGATTPRRRVAASSTSSTPPPVPKNDEMRFEVDPRDLEVMGLVDFARTYQALTPDDVAERISKLEAIGRGILCKPGDSRSVSIKTVTAETAADFTRAYLDKYHLTKS
ncbi:hypothetical protein MAPG_09957 [Magnaporthiopsis poae ATCC 64411]|uniref:Uncharacterized protein n=1 Tax=Magnaporthiopsis poae (strain ATCC 64411 / 73-15) TaxID=644358 RepID=A0A0C4EBB0_MAGP6|nr:hypothetical protein MAPG_09957 [Magnaporthiopsis poae ATCC 64411]